MSPSAGDLRERVAVWAERLHVEPKQIRIFPMRRKWGSCSSTGIVTLATELGCREPDFRDFVIAHELLHLRYQHHSRLFKATLSLHIPNWRALDASR